MSPVFGGVRYDFTPPTHVLALGEDWPLRWAIEDENGVALANFTGITEWGFALLERLDIANGWTAALAAKLISETLSGGGISATVPNVDVTITAAGQAAAVGGALTVRPYAYELWKLAGAPVRRVAYGLIVPVA